MHHTTMTDTVHTPDSVALAVQRHSSSEPATAAGSVPSRPTIVAVHGYPDNSGVWNAMIPYLVPSADIVTYDVRGTGGSESPESRSGYAFPHLVDDLDAVVEWAAHAPATPPSSVHLLAHDWGSIQAWQAVTDVGAAARVASFTSVSGPCLDHVERWFRSGLRRGSDHRRETLRQLGASSYIALFKLRGVAEFAGATGLLARIMSSATDSTVGIPGFVRHRRDIVDGLELYRQNMLTRGGRGGNIEPRRTDVPVQVVTPTQDPYVRPALGACATGFLPDVTVTSLDAGHWAIASHPERMAELVTTFVQAHDA